MKKEKKENLTNEISKLENKFNYLSGKNYNVNDCYNEYKFAEESYKKAKKDRNRYKRIKNLKLTSAALILMVPVVITTSMVGLVDHVLFENRYHKDYATQELQVIEADNMGNYDSKLDDEDINAMELIGEIASELDSEDINAIKLIEEIESAGKDKINITSCWFEDDNKLVSYKYEALTDLHTEDEVKEIINTDYFSLMDKYDFKEKIKIFALASDAVEKELSSDYKIEVNAKVKMNEELCKQYIEPIKNQKKETIKYSALIGSMFGAEFVAAVYFLICKKFITNVKKEYKQCISYNNLSKAQIKDKKQKYKSLKKKL